MLHSTDIESVSLLWSNIMEPQQLILNRKLLKYNLHLTERDLRNEENNTLKLERPEPKSSRDPFDFC